MYSKKYSEVITIENILTIWEQFLRGKRKKKDVIKFQVRLAENLVSLYHDLHEKTYKHGHYSAFNISDPKPRNIHKASVRDRFLHHIIYRELYPYFEPRFIYDLYSCRKNKGTHRALNRFREFAGRVSRNHTRTCFVLKCDIKKFFASINQVLLMKILGRHIEDAEILPLIQEVVSSFHTTEPRIGLPLGNLTSQLLANIYMNEFDRFAKHSLKAECYTRYADDFVILSDDYEWLFGLIPRIRHFLREKLKLELHPGKVFIKTVVSGVDFLGWVHFPDHRVLRTATKRRMLKKLARAKSDAALQSYLGLLRHGNGEKIKRKILNCGASLVGHSNGFFLILT